MGQVAGRRVSAEVDGDFVVFLIGARPNSKLHLLRSLIDLGGRRGMKHMLDYLIAHPEKGLLAYELGFPTIVQYCGPSSSSRRSPRMPLTRISLPGATTGAGSARATAPGSGTRPIR